MKVVIGDTVFSCDFGPGKVVAMTNQWCIYASKTGDEFALPWEAIYIEAEPIGICSQLEERSLDA